MRGRNNWQRPSAPQVLRPNPTYALIVERAIIALERRDWCRPLFAVDENGEAVSWRSTRATAYNIEAALCIAATSLFPEMGAACYRAVEAGQAVNQVLRKEFGVKFEPEVGMRLRFNDDPLTDKVEVIRVLRQALQIWRPAPKP